MKRDTLERLLEEREAKRAVVLVTDLGSGEERLLRPLDDPRPDDVDGEVWEAALRAVEEDRSRPLEKGGRTLFLAVQNPPLRLLLVGAVHVSQPLAKMARIAGFEVTVSDPRRAFATEARFPGVELMQAWPREALEELEPDHRTAVVTLTHDPKLDDPALVSALASDAYYVGALGSTRTHAERVERLRREGVAEEALERIHAPVGLDLGARTPEEIAVSVLAEVVAVLRGREA